MTKQVEQFYKNFKAPKGFIVPDEFPIMRGRSVLIKKENLAERANKAGIVIPENVEGVNKFVGRVWACGPECVNLIPGMRVIFNAMANQLIPVEVNGFTEEFMFMYDLDVYAILPEGINTMTRTVKREGRRQFSYDELPDQVSKAEIEEERLKKELTPKVIEIEKKLAGRITFAVSKK